MNLESYLTNIPKLHTWDGGKTWNTGGFERTHFKQLAKLLTPNMKLLETGCGNSTIFFLISKPSDFYSVDPNPVVFERIKKFCHENQIDTSSLHAITEPSEIVLPQLAEKHPGYFDFVLIDGDHGWPNVMVDFCYGLRMLATDGLLMIDDIQLHSVRELMNLLDEQPQFERVLKMNKAIVYRRIGDMQTMPGWSKQPYIARKSKRYIWF